MYEFINDWCIPVTSSVEIEAWSFLPDLPKDTMEKCPKE